MGNKGVLALRKQLKREQFHVQWLEQHLPNSRQLNSAQQRVAQLCVLKCVVESAALPTTNATTIIVDYDLGGGVTAFAAMHDKPAPTGGADTDNDLTAIGLNFAF